MEGQVQVGVQRLATHVQQLFAERGAAGGGAGTAAQAAQAQPLGTDVVKQGVQVSQH